MWASVLFLVDLTGLVEVEGAVEKMGRLRVAPAGTKTGFGGGGGGGVGNLGGGIGVSSSSDSEDSTSAFGVGVGEVFVAGLKGTDTFVGRSVLAGGLRCGVTGASWFAMSSSLSSS